MVAPFSTTAKRPKEQRFDDGEVEWDDRLPATTPAKGQSFIPKVAQAQHSTTKSLLRLRNRKRRWQYEAEEEEEEDLGIKVTSLAPKKESERLIKREQPSRACKEATGLCSQRNENARHSRPPSASTPGSQPKAYEELLSAKDTHPPADDSLARERVAEQKVEERKYRDGVDDLTTPKSARDQESTMKQSKYTPRDGTFRKKTKYNSSYTGVSASTSFRKQATFDPRRATTSSDKRGQLTRSNMPKNDEQRNERGPTKKRGRTVDAECLESCEEQQMGDSDEGECVRDSDHIVRGQQVSPSLSSCSSRVENEATLPITESMKETAVHDSPHDSDNVVKTTADARHQVDFRFVPPYTKRADDEHSEASTSVFVDEKTMASHRAFFRGATLDSGAIDIAGFSDLFGDIRNSRVGSFNAFSEQMSRAGSGKCDIGRQKSMGRRKLSQRVDSPSRGD